jgi:asparagine synthase (glutamine-hydrolysing)
MSGIVGVWNTDGRPVERELLLRLAEPLAYRGPDGCHLWREGPVGLACQQLKVTPESAREVQPLVDASGAVLVFDGRLDDREELLATLDRAHVNLQSPDPDIILAAYRTHGEDFAARLKGDFALALWDPARRQLLLLRDMVGLRPLYYFQAGAQLVFATEIKALLAHPGAPRKPNDDVLAWWMFRQPALDTNGQTLFDGILRVQPGYAVVVTPDRLAVRQHSDFSRTRQVRFTSPPEYFDAFREVFQRAVARRLRSAHPLAFSVSGGLDSSSIFCCAHRLSQARGAGAPPLRAFSYVGAEGTLADESEFLAAVERECGIAIERFPAPMHFREKVAQPTWHAEFPLITEMTPCIEELYSRLRREGARVLVSGLWGDQVLVDHSYLVGLFRRFHWRELFRHLGAYTEWCPDVAPAGVRQRFYSDLLRSYIPDAVMPALRRVNFALFNARPHSPYYTRAFRHHRRWDRFEQPRRAGFASRHARSLYYTVRSGHHLLAMELDNKVAARFGAETWYPFLDQDLLAFLMAIPGEVQSHEGVPKAILRHAMRGILPHPIETRKGKAEGTDTINLAMSAGRPQLFQLLQPTSAAVQRGYVEATAPERLQGLRDPAAEQDALLSSELADLFGLELWLRLFFSQPTTEIPLPTWA